MQAPILAGNTWLLQQRTTPFLHFLSSFSFIYTCLLPFISKLNIALVQCNICEQLQHLAIDHQYVLAYVLMLYIFFFTYTLLANCFFFYSSIQRLLYFVKHTRIYSVQTAFLILFFLSMTTRFRQRLLEVVNNSHMLQNTTAVGVANDRLVESIGYVLVYCCWWIAYPWACIVFS